MSSFSIVSRENQGTVSVRVSIFSNYTIKIFKKWDSHPLCVIAKSCGVLRLAYIGYRTVPCLSKLTFQWLQTVPCLRFYISGIKSIPIPVRYSTSTSVMSSKNSNFSCATFRAQHFP